MLVKRDASKKTVPLSEHITADELLEVIRNFGMNTVVILGPLGDGFGTVLHQAEQMGVKVFSA